MPGFVNVRNVGNFLMYVNLQQSVALILLSKLLLLQTTFQKTILYVDVDNVPVDAFVDPCSSVYQIDSNVVKANMADLSLLQTK